MEVEQLPSTGGTSSNEGKHPYQRIDFWIDPTNQFWNHYLYSKTTRDKYNKWLSDWIKKEKYLPSLEKNI